MPRNFLGILLLGSVSLGMAGNDLSYRNRGSRFEGTKAKPIGGYEVELLGAVVEPVPTADFSDRAAVSFFLEREESVHFLIREREPKEHYRLDQVTPASPWRPGAANTFSWPSGEVLRPLGLRPADLLFLARLGSDKPRSREHVAPVLLEPATGGRQVSGYRFTFRLQSTAKTRHAIYGPGSPQPLQPVTPYSRRAADTPFEIFWSAEGRAEGIYRLVLEGYFTSDSQPLQQVVEIFHSPTWPG
jgi:hypothetical protein